MMQTAVATMRATPGLASLDDLKPFLLDALARQGEGRAMVGEPRFRSEVRGDGFEWFEALADFT